MAPPHGIIPPTLLELAATFVELQEFRHIADYDLAYTPSRLGARTIVGQAEQAFADIRALSGDPVCNLRGSPASELSTSRRKPGAQSEGSVFVSSGAGLEVSSIDIADASQDNPGEISLSLGKDICLIGVSGDSGMHQLTPVPNVTPGPQLALEDLDGDGADEVLCFYPRTPGGVPAIVALGDTLTVGGESSVRSLFSVTQAVVLAPRPGQEGWRFDAAAPPPGIFAVGSATNTILEIEVSPAVGQGTLAVSNSLGNTIGIFSPTDTLAGDVPPSVLVNSASLNQPFHIASDLLPTGEFYVTNPLAQSVTVFSKQNPVNPTRVISGPNTTLTFTGGIALDTGTDTLYVGNFPGGGSVSVFHPASTANGDVAPVRRLTGFQGLFGLALDPVNDRLYAAQVGGDSVAVFDHVSTLDGAVVPDHLISGLTDPEGLCYHRRRLFVATQADGLLIYDVADIATGNAPLGLQIPGIPARDVTLDPTRGELTVSTLNQKLLRYRLEPSTFSKAPIIMGTVHRERPEHATGRNHRRARLGDHGVDVDAVHHTRRHRTTGLRSVPATRPSTC